MPIRKSSRQKNVPDGKVRYQFDFSFKRDGFSKRFRENFIYKPEEVKSKHKSWLQDKTIEAVNLLNEWETGSEEKPSEQMLFENLDKFLQHYLFYEYKGDNSNSHYKSFIRSFNRFKIFFNDMQLNDFRKFHIEDYIIWRRNFSEHSGYSGISDRTINIDIMALSKFFSWCIDREIYHKRNPASKMKLKENNNRYIKPENHWLEELHQATGKVRIAVFLAVYAGLRKGEVVSLKWSDIDLDNCVIQLKTQNTKNEKYRQPVIPQFFRDELIGFRKSNPFGDHVLQGWNYHKIDREWRTFRNSLSFQYFTDARTGKELRMTFHDLRHIHAFLLLKAGASMIEIQHQLGHYSIRVTEDRYANVSSQIEQEKVDRINFLGSKASGI